MPYCPQCRQEYRAGFFECADCGVPLVDYLPPEPAVPAPDRMEGPSVETRPVVVYVAGSEVEAHVIKGRLENEGIPAMLQGESLQWIEGATIKGVRVLVPEPLAEAARELIGENLAE